MRIKTFTVTLFTALTLTTIVFTLHADGERPCYPWRDANATQSDTIATRFSPPDGYIRSPAAAASFAEWLRNIPLAPEGTPVRLHDGSLKWSQEPQAAVMDIDVGTRNLQQCADAVMRLRAEYLYATRQDNRICFRFSDGSAASWSKWTQGFRPNLAKKPVIWSRTGKSGSSYSTFGERAAAPDRR
jgi:hypothetical protein